MNQKLKKLLSIEIMFHLIVGFLLFINLKVWEKTETIHMMIFYYLIYFVFRYISYGLGTYFILKSKIIFLIRVAFFFMVLQFLSLLFILDYINNEWLWISLIAFPTAFFASFYSMAFNQLVSYYGKQKEYPTFFSYKTYIASALGFFVPLMVGFFVRDYGFQTISFVLLLVSIICLGITFTIKPITLNFDSKKTFIQDLLKTKNMFDIPRTVLISHTLFLLIGGFVFQFTDIFKSIFSFMIAKDDFYLGVLNSIFFIISTIALILFKKIKNVSQQSWFLFSGIILSLSIFLTYFPNDTTLLIVCFLFAFGMFFYRTMYHSVSFQLMNNLNNYEKFIILFKREMVSLLGKISFTFVTFIFAFNTIEDIEYKYISLIVLVLMGIMIYLYYYIFRFIENIESE